MSEEQVLASPFSLFESWFEEAVATEPRVAEAMQLGTADDQGQPTVRTVLMKDFSEQGLSFFTNLLSRKARHLGSRPVASACFHWKVLERQVIIEGSVVRLSRAQDERYFATRDRGSQLGAWASEQSQSLASAELMQQAVADAAARFHGEDVPCPPFWGGYRLIPNAFEFWQGREDRLHIRRLFERSSDGQWAQRLLWP